MVSPPCRKSREILCKRHAHCWNNMNQETALGKCHTMKHLLNFLYILLLVSYITYRMTLCNFDIVNLHKEHKWNKLKIWGTTGEKMNQSLKNWFMISWIVVMVVGDIPLIVCSAIAIQTDSTPRNAVSLLVGWIIHAIIACLVGAFWCFMTDADNRGERQDEKEDIDIATTWGQSATEYPIV